MSLFLAFSDSILSAGVDLYVRSVSIELIYYRLSAFCALSKLREALRQGKDSLMFKKKNDGNGEKIFRYSIRKYHFGAASVAVAALMFCQWDSTGANA